MRTTTGRTATEGKARTRVLTEAENALEATDGEQNHFPNIFDKTEALDEAAPYPKKFSGKPRSIEERKRNAHCAVCGNKGHWQGDGAYPMAKPPTSPPSSARPRRRPTRFRRSSFLVRQISLDMLS